MVFRYIWIDSLCIIQDSRIDWERESSLMAGIYGNSALTIAGPATGNSEAGFLARKSQPLSSIDIPYKGPENMPTEIKITICHVDEKAYSQWQWEADDILATRAWVLQERLLSPRVIYFGSRIMYWECMACYRREDFHLPIESQNHYGSSVSKKSLDELNDFALRGYWYDIVRTCSNCRLTVPMDKTPAISGIAHMLSDKLQDEYLAGLWKKEIHSGLSWYVEQPLNDTRDAEIKNTFIAPSWSWASVPRDIHFNYHRAVHTRAVQKQLYMLREDFDTVEATVEPEGTDELGMIRAAKLRMRFCVKQAFLKVRTESRGIISSVDICDSRTRQPVASFRPDYLEYLVNLDSSEEHEVLCLLLGYSQREGEFHFNAMVVEPVSPDKLQYRRVGMVQYLSGVSPGNWSLVPQRPHDYVKFGEHRINLRSVGVIAPGDWFENFERWILELV